MTGRQCWEIQRATAVGLLLAAGFAATGCSQQGVTERGREAGGALSLADFRGSDAVPEAAAPSGGAQPGSPTGTTPGPSGKPVRTVPVIPERVMMGGVRDVVVVAGEPRDAVRSEAKPLGKAVLVDQVIGQINGRPVYAHQFLAPIDARLKQLLVQNNNNARAWAAAAAKLINERLVAEIQDELFLAEARAALTPEEKQGLIHFLTSIREGLASMSGGSEERAEERLLETEGLTLEEKARDERDKALIRSLVQRQIQPRVNVSWRDVRRAYDKNYDVFNPPPVAVIRMVWAEPAQPGKPSPQEQITRLLSEGKAFEDIARSEWNGFLRDEAGMAPKRPIEGPYEKATIFADATLNSKAQSLTVGQVTGPFAYQNRMVWMKLEAIEQRRGKSLAEAQVELMAALRQKKYGDELNRFFQRLLERGSFSDVGLMTERLLAVAVERYIIADAAAAPAGSPPSAPPRPATPEK